MADRRRTGRLSAVVLALIVAATSALAGAVRPQRVVENATVIVQRVRVDAHGAAEFPFRRLPTVLVNVGDRSTVFVAAGQDKRVTNTRATAADVIAIGIKPSRRPAAAAPATAAPPGIKRDTIIDNDQVRVVHVTFATDGREPVHTHPNDLVTVQLTPGRVEMLRGTSKRTIECAAGFIQFLPRNVQHAYASADSKPFELLSVAIK